MTFKRNVVEHLIHLPIKELCGGRRKCSYLPATSGEV